MISIKDVSQVPTPRHATHHLVYRHDTTPIDDIDYKLQIGCCWFSGAHAITMRSRSEGEILSQRYCYINEKCDIITVREWVNWSFHVIQSSGKPHNYVLISLSYSHSLARRWFAYPFMDSYFSMDQTLAHQRAKSIPRQPSLRLIGVFSLFL